MQAIDSDEWRQAEEDSSSFALLAPLEISASIFCSTACARAACRTVVGGHGACLSLLDLLLSEAAQRGVVVFLQDGVATIARVRRDCFP